MGLMGEIMPGIREGKSFVRGSEGVEVYDEIRPQQGDTIIEKHRFSAFYGTDLDLILRSLHKDTVIIIGYSTNLGCETTARDATNRGYKVIFPSDGSMARGLPDMGWGAVSREDIQRVVLSTMAYRFAMVLTIEELISRLN
jgi:ureidoacrylate peracid hydrolase